MSPSSFLAVVNPAAGGGRCGKLAGPALERLRSAGIPLDVAECQYPGHATLLAREAYKQGRRRFLAVGGDGTSYEIVNGLFPAAQAEGTATLALLPLGTGNSFLRDFTEAGAQYAVEAILGARSRACEGGCRSSSAQREKVPKSCVSRSLRSVSTTSVGFAIAGGRSTRPA